MMIDVKYSQEKNHCTVQPWELDRLIQLKKIVAFKRGEGWVQIGKMPVRGKGGSYVGDERRQMPAEPTLELMWQRIDELEKQLRESTTEKQITARSEPNKPGAPQQEPTEGVSDLREAEILTHHSSFLQELQKEFAGEAQGSMKTVLVGPKLFPYSLPPQLEMLLLDPEDQTIVFRPTTNPDSLKPKKGDWEVGKPIDAVKYVLEWAHKMRKCGL